MFPDDWGASCAKRHKICHSHVDGTDHQAVAQGGQVGFTSDLEDTILRGLMDEQSAEQQQGVTPMDVTHILSKVSYRSMLENLFHDSAAAANEVPIFTRAYEESKMRQPLKGEAACVMGANCECQFLDPKLHFTAVEVRLPHDPPQPQMCVLCSRKTTQKLFYDMCFAGEPVKGVIQRWGNIFGTSGEYAPECMLSCSAPAMLVAMPVPCMSHQRNRYTVEVRGGVRSLKQNRVAPEDFQPPSVCASTP